MRLYVPLEGGIERLHLHSVSASLTSRRQTGIYGELAKDTIRKETDSLGVVEVAADRLWRCADSSLEHFSIGTDLIPREMKLRRLHERGRTECLQRGKSQHL
jgi:hypothetical protein